ncbi:hypothetical protein KSP40_PGU002559 [Platanthera guangdongensis]|uniref:Uncharacterized protein n=1 Tax=Platanthera guangdongensis TaxID=2320717 RepID=A0ABR2M6G8_9ASPA
MMAEIYIPKIAGPKPTLIICSLLLVPPLKECLFLLHPPHLLHKASSSFSPSALVTSCKSHKKMKVLPATALLADRRLTIPATTSLIRRRREKAGTGCFRSQIWLPRCCYRGYLPLELWIAVMMPTEERPAVEELQQTMEVEEIADKEMEETTENDLMVVKAELQKVLAAEEEKEMATGDRISSASAVAGVKGDKECPLQGFLFGLPVEVGSTALLAPESGHDRRASLAELFTRSRAEEELLPTEKREGLSVKGMNVKMKKMLKRRRTVRGNTGGRKYEAVESNKLFKILRIFRKKIYPEAATETGKYGRPSQPEEKEKVCINNYYNRKLLYDDGNTAQESSEGEDAISIPTHRHPKVSARTSRGIASTGLRPTLTIWFLSFNGRSRHQDEVKSFEEFLPISAVELLKSEVTSMDYLSYSLYIIYI